MRPQGLLGIHLNTQYAFPTEIPDVLSPAERYAVDGLALYNGDLGGSSHLQGTKPETVRICSGDSPTGQAAWIYEKFQSKTDNRGLAEDALSIDDMLDSDLALLVHQQCRLVRPNLLGEQVGQFRRPEANAAGRRDGIPWRHPTPATKLDRRDTYTNLIHYGEADRGGHFAALEQPEVLISEIRAG